MRARHGKGWLPDEILTLVEAFNAGCSIVEMARQLDRTERAVQIRLERQGLIGGDSLTHSNVGVGDLTSSLAPLTAATSHGECPRSATTAMARAYDKSDTTALQFLPSHAACEEGSDSDTPSDRLREALIGLVTACVRERKRQFITLQLLGLEGDGIPPNMATLARTLNRSRERIRQLRNSALRQISSKLPRRIASTDQLRSVLKGVSPDTDWTKPGETASQIVRLATDNFAAAELLAFICCRVAGANAPADALREQCAAAVDTAANGPEPHSSWRFDRWEAAQTKAIFLAQAHFESPPPDLMGLKRTPDPRSATAIDISSKLLGRTVLCESGTERRIYKWLERSPDVRWYQEQPTSLPYQFAGKEHRYYPDVAVMSTGGQIVVVEVKPIYQMYRHRTLAKANAAIRRFGARGIGFLLVDDSGRTLADLARHPYSPKIADAIEKLFSREPVPFRQIEHELVRLGDRFDFLTFVSMVVNRDWGVTDAPGVRVFKLSDELSFHALRHGNASRLTGQPT